MNNKPVRRSGGKKYNTHQGNFILKSQFMSDRKSIDNHHNFEISLRGSGIKSNNLNGYNNNENLINEGNISNNSQIKGQMLNWNIQPQLYYYQNGSQNQIMPNNNFTNINNSHNSNSNKYENSNVGTRL